MPAPAKPVRTPALRRLRRPHIVWASLLTAMTGVGGLLLALEDRPAPPPSLASAVRVAPGGRQVDIQPTAALDRDRWLSVVVHHSGDSMGSAASLAKEHESQGLRGLGHHFVITNGHGGGDGEIQIGYRWRDQLPGAHTAGPAGDEFNRRGIGICLVGDGERRPFTDAQISSLVRLIASLQRELGIPDDAVRLHRDVASTSSPGRLFPEAVFRTHLAASR